MIHYPAMDSLPILHETIRACRLCEEAGYIERAAPVVAGRMGNRMMLVGQAPGITELAIRRPFAGQAGKVLFRWMDSIGIDEQRFRDHVYMTAVTKCFPGKVSGGKGDRRPSTPEIALCRPYLEQQLVLIQPEIIIPVGSLAIERWFPRTSLDALIGRRFDRESVSYIPLPHPSGASRWLNAPEHRELLRNALQLVREEWDRACLP